MLLIAVFITIGVIAAIGSIITIVRNKDVFFPKHQK
jgi:multisubunit Na+/H+ antiporter MnhG subunit